MVDKNTYHAGSQSFTMIEQRDRFRELYIQNLNGEISELEVKPKMKIGPAELRYTPTFSYRNDSGVKVYEDVLDATPRTTMGNIKRAWKKWGVGRLEIIAKRKRKGFRVICTINPESEDGEIDGNR